MQNIATALKAETFSFSGPGTGTDSGAIGTYQTPIMLPFGAVVKNVTVNCSVPFTSTTNKATIAVGWVNVTSPNFLGAFIPATIVTNAMFSPSAGSNPAITSGDPKIVYGSTYNFPIAPSGGAKALRYVFITITVEALTAGAATFTIEYL